MPNNDCLKLRECPFCGGKAEYNKKIPAIICTKCKAQIRGVKAYRLIPAYCGMLVGFWNRRVEHE